MSSARTIRKAVLIGATGNVGSLLVAPLREAFDLTIITRPSSVGPFPDGVPVLRAEYTLDALSEAFRGQDAVVSAIGSADFLVQKVMIDAAIKAGVQRFLPSELSINGIAPAVRELVPVFQLKWEVLEYLKAKEASGLTWTGLGTGPVIDWGLNEGFIGFDINGRKAKIWDNGEVLFSAITVADLGRAVVEVLHKPEETKNRYIFANSVTASHAEILKELEQATGQAWEVEHISTAADIAVGREQIASGNLFGMFKLVQASAWGNLPGLRQNFEVDEKEALANDVLGIQPTRIDSIVREVVASRA